MSSWGRRLHGVIEFFELGYRVFINLNLKVGGEGNNRISKKPSNEKYYFNTHAVLTFPFI